jgi:hypothetical protein
MNSALRVLFAVRFGNCVRLSACVILVASLLADHGMGKSLVPAMIDRAQPRPGALGGGAPTSGDNPVGPGSGTPQKKITGA